MLILSPSDGVIMRRRKNAGLVKTLTQKKYTLSLVGLVAFGVVVHYLHPQIQAQLAKLKSDKSGLGALGMKANGAHMGAIGMGGVHKAGMHVNPAHMGALHLNPGHMGAIGMQGLGAIGMQGFGAIGME